MQSKQCSILFFSLISPLVWGNSELPSLDLDKLMAADIRTTSVMKRVQNASETAASLYVLTNQELIMSGVTSVPQALSLVPGVQVRRIDANQYAITTRAPAGRYSSKTLVMIDGQSIYNPSFAGVYWEALDIPIYDIERIEVIRGQGGLLWGSNATNGVVNIITKHSEDTRGVLFQARTGSDIDNSVDFRLGGELGNRSTFRLYASSELADPSEQGVRITPTDSHEKKSAGGRIDISTDDSTSLLVQGQYSDVSIGQGVRLSDPDTNERMDVVDTNRRKHAQLMMRLEQRLSDDVNHTLQASWAMQQGKQVYYHEDFNFYDIDYHMNTLLNGWQFDWGVNYRYNDLSSEPVLYTDSLNDEDEFSLYGAYVQAQFDLIPDELKLVIGNKSEHNSYTGWEHQPMARLTWISTPKHTAWAAVSQSVRIPCLLEYDLAVDSLGPKVGNYITTPDTMLNEQRLNAEIRGTTDAKAEHSVSTELGYRYTGNDWTMDLSVFRTEANNVLAVSNHLDPENALEQAGIAMSVGDFNSVNEIISNSTLVYQLGYTAELESYGGEVVLGWKAADNVKAELGYSQTTYDYSLAPDTASAVGFSSDLQQIFLKGSVHLYDEHTLYAVFRVEDGEAYSTDDFSTLDLTWNWQIAQNYSFTLTGNNLFYGRHLEYSNTSESFTIPTYIEPSVVARIKAEF
ncbi:ligand-gated channel protein [Vibrio albus]|uniref:Ligand-gated channel protein n=1 Tax=Vibrio albus TaxID=2200953 RepID=A0A2U3B5V7_9VIBR|nr:TonB-dependent receptor [Vibrio albus]PWI32183.1 ligand-gated channel protein [Vibrio albus]